MLLSSVAKVLHALNPQYSISHSHTGAFPEGSHDQEWLAQHTQSHDKNILPSLGMLGHAMPSLKNASDQAEPIDTENTLL
jgi:hypothetical protein